MILEDQEAAIEKLKKKLPELFKKAKIIGTRGFAGFTYRKCYKKPIIDIFGQATEYIFTVTVILIDNNKCFFQISEGVTEYGTIIAQYVMKDDENIFWKIDS